MYVTVRRYHVDPGSVDEVLRRVNEDFVPVITGAPGFKVYYIVNVGAGVLASISIFEDQETTEESNKLSAEWVKANLASFVQGLPEITAGEANVHTRLSMQASTK